MQFISFTAPNIEIYHVVISLILDKNLLPKSTNENAKCAVNPPNAVQKFPHFPSAFNQPKYWNIIFFKLMSLNLPNRKIHWNCQVPPFKFPPPPKKRHFDLFHFVEEHKKGRKKRWKRRGNAAWWSGGMQVIGSRHNIAAIKVPHWALRLIYEIDGKTMVLHRKDPNDVRIAQLIRLGHFFVMWGGFAAPLPFFLIQWRRELKLGKI